MMWVPLLAAQAAGAAAEIGIADITIPDLFAALGLIAIAIGISRWRSLGLERKMLVAVLRTTVQLILVGYVLFYIFAIRNPLLVAAALGLMLLVASHTAVSNQADAPRALLPITGFAMFVGSVLTLAWVTLLVVHAEPFYDPRYVIPLFGMIAGNSMNAATLAGERLRSELLGRKAEIEALLAIGASTEQASEAAVRKAITAAMLPTLNSMMTVGIVSLPGMMTGQVIAGASPLVAVRYQIVVMFMLAAAVAITATLVTLRYRNLFFSPGLQFRSP